MGPGIGRHMTLWLDVVRRLCATGAVLVLAMALAFGQPPLEGDHGPAGHHHGAAGHPHAGHHEAGLAEDGGGHDHAGPLGGFAPHHCNSVLCTPALAIVRSAPASLESYGLVAFTVACDNSDLRSIVPDRDPPIPRLSA
jgi:hypothetical protein